MSFFRPEIDAMTGYQSGEQPQVGKFIKLNTNENPYPASASVARAVQNVMDRGLSRYPDATASAFRQRAAEVLGIDPDWILCGNGSDDILTIVTRAMVGERQRIRFPYPSYVLYRTLAEIQGAQFEEIAFQSDWSLSDEFATTSDDLRLAFLPNPNSPSGTVLPPDRVAELAEAIDCPLLVDEAYVDFAESDCLALVRDHENVMVSRTLSKSYALAGLRFGYLVAQPHIIANLNKVKDSYNCDAFSIAAATAAIDDRAWLERTRAAILTTRARLAEQLQRLGFAVTPSHANFVWATHADRPVERIYQRLKKERILVRYMQYPGWGDGLRITVGTNDQVDAMLAVLSTI